MFRRFKMRPSSIFPRRSFLTTGISAGAAVIVAGAAFGRRALAAPFELPKLPYDYAALEPHIDAETMKIHHDMHHQAYVTNLNKALGEEAGKVPIEELLANKAEKAPAAVKQMVINNGGGHLNHTMFWESMGPNAGGEPKGALAEAIKSTFTDFKSFAEKMNDTGVKRFGSGWVWLAKGADGKLEIYSTANQDSPVMEGKKAILGIDVWEHAYYLKYKSKRADYLKAIWNVINWDAVGKRFA
jgi:Fe-Mn family superoxide dismutase